MANTIEVARIEYIPPGGMTTRFYSASRIYYPQHPANAIEFDDATTGLRTVLFGAAIVHHLAADAGPKSPVFTSVAYYGFWLFWLAVFLGGAWVVARWAAQH